MATKESLRPWREIATKNCEEQDAKRISELCEELTLAFDEQKSDEPDSKVTDT